MQHGNEIHGSKREQRTESNDLRCSFPRNAQHSEIGDNADDPLVENGTSRFWAEIAKDFPGDYVIAAHAVKETRCSDVTCQSTRHTGNQEHDSISSKEQGAASNSSHIHERGFRVYQRGMFRPHKLRHVY